MFLAILTWWVIILIFGLVGLPLAFLGLAFFAIALYVSKLVVAVE